MKNVPVVADTLSIMHRRRHTIRCVSACMVSACAAMMGCSDKDNPPPQANDVNNTSGRAAEQPQGGQPFPHADWQPSDDPTTIVNHGLAFTKPVTWIETPPITSLRDANYTIPGVPKTADHPGGDSAELVFFYMNAEEAMTPEAHVDRWLQQFAPDEDGKRPTPWIDTITAGGEEVSIYELRGRYVRSGSAWFTPGQAMIAAIVDVPNPDDESDTAATFSGGQLIIRLTGPEATVDANRRAFIAMIESFRAVQDAQNASSPP